MPSITKPSPGSRGESNKRTALAAALVFLELNGISVNDDPKGRLYDAMMMVANKQLDKKGLAKILKDLGQD